MLEVDRWFHLAHLHHTCALAKCTHTHTLMTCFSCLSSMFLVTRQNRRFSSLSSFRIPLKKGMLTQAMNHEEMFHELILSEKKDAPKLNPRWSNRGLKAKIFGRWSRSSFYARKESLLSPKAVTFMAWKVSWTCRTWRDPTNTQNVVICRWSIYELW